MAKYDAMSYHIENKKTRDLIRAEMSIAQVFVYHTFWSYFWNIDLIVVSSKVFYGCLSGSIE